MPFTLIRERSIPEIDSLARLYRHDGTGARFLSLITDDENKVFGICFRTPSADSTGVAHIMEHSVLCGSRKYPVKEPFVELMKGSLNTFLNAMTYPDKTCYPVASTNLADFYNLIDVYLDAVFYPLISPDTLRQEGWHYELESVDGPLSYKGVVFNEMKGAYSDPENKLEDAVRRSLYPDSSYALDSGGDPAIIPTLSYEAFKAFHDTYYHPSNSWIFMYGDDDPAKRLEILESWLGDFQAKEVESMPVRQSAFSQPVTHRESYDAGERPDAASYVTVNWLLDPKLHKEAGTTSASAGSDGEYGNADTQRLIELGILANILTTTSASPLRRALIESGLGEDLAGSGFAAEYRQMHFSIGLKGVKPGTEGEVEALILSTLQRLAAEGLDPETVKASLNSTEFALREKNTGRLPRGIAMGLAAVTGWIYDEDPIEALRFEEDLKRVTRLAETGHFEALIRQYFLDNPHRSTVILVPDSEEGRRSQEAENARLAEAKAAMDEAALQAVMEEAEALRARQERPDSPEALATIPSLTLADLDPRIHLIPLEVEESGGATILSHDLPTSSILYLDVGFDLHALPERLVPYVGLLGRLLLETGTARQDFIALSQRIGQKTGGIYGTAAVMSVRETRRSQAWFMLRSKVLAGGEEELLAILSEVLMSARLDNRERIRQIVLEDKAQAEAAVVPSGHRVVASRLKARFAEADRIGEEIEGLESLFFLRSLASRIENDWEAVARDLAELRTLLINRRSCLVNITADATHLASLRPRLFAFLGGLPSSEPALRDWDADRAAGLGIPGLAGMLSPREGCEAIVLPSQVNFVGQMASLYDAGYSYDGSIHVVNKYLQSTWLWEKIRVQGGAYGGFSMFDKNTGLFGFLSYRDPAIMGTLRSFGGTADFLAALDLPDTERIKSIIGTIGDVDAYLLPDAKGYTSMIQYLSGMTPGMRQAARDQILGTTAADFRDLASWLRSAMSSAVVSVLGSPDAVEKAVGEGLAVARTVKVF